MVRSCSPPACGTAHRRLEQQQALLRIDAIRAAAQLAARERELVHRLVVGLQRQLEAALAAGRAMAGAELQPWRVSAATVSVRNETGAGWSTAVDDNWHRNLLIGDAHLELTTAVAGRMHSAVAEIGNLRIGRGDLRHPAQIDDAAVGKETGHEHDRLLARRMQLQLLRLDFDALERRQIDRRIFGASWRMRQCEWTSNAAPIAGNDPEKAAVWSKSYCVVITALARLLSSLSAESRRSRVCSDGDILPLDGRRSNHNQIVEFARWRGRVGRERYFDLIASLEP